MVKGEKEEVKTAEEAGKQTSRTKTSFTRSIALPKGIDGEGHTANLKDGILTVNLKKVAPAKQEAVKIEIA